MNTTHTNGPIEQKEKQKAARLLDEFDLRDYFAAKAMAAMMASPSNVAKAMDKLGVTEDDVLNYLAAGSYAMADAMLKARQSNG
jgi:hypothetical protein